MKITTRRLNKLTAYSILLVQYQLVKYLYIGYFDLKNKSNKNEFSVIIGNFSKGLYPMVYPLINGHWRLCAC